MPPTAVYSDAEMKERYGHFYESASHLPLDQERIPRNLWPLIPYAGFWGISDDWARESLVRKAPEHVKDNLKAVVAAYDNFLDEWLAGAEASNSKPTPEYVAFSAMRMAADFI